MTTGTNASTPTADATVAATTRTTRVATPVGTLTLVASDAGLRAVSWGAADDDAVEPGEADVDDPVLHAAVVQLAEYFEGRRQTFDLPLDPRGTPFQLEVWEVLRTIPYGATITYGEQADRLGDRRKIRAVAAANGRNPLPIIVPCHRVIGADGSLTGFAGGLPNKAWLLAHERGQGRLDLPTPDG